MFYLHKIKLKKIQSFQEEKFSELSQNLFVEKKMKNTERKRKD